MCLPKEMKLTFKTMPLTTNSLYAHSGRVRFMTIKGKENKEAIAWEARSQYRGQPLGGSVGLKIDLCWPDRRNHDIDNIKVLIDALTGICWLDDGQITSLQITKRFEKGNARVTLEAIQL